MVTDTDLAVEVVADTTEIATVTVMTETIVIVTMEEIVIVINQQDAFHLLVACVLHSHKLVRKTFLWFLPSQKRLHTRTVMYRVRKTYNGHTQSGHVIRTLNANPGITRQTLFEQVKKTSGITTTSKLSKVLHHLKVA